MCLMPVSYANHAWACLCRCDTPGVRAVLGADRPSDRTLLQYLGVLEQRSTEVLQEYVSLAAQGSDAASAQVAMVLHSSARAGPLELSIDPPSAVVPTLGDSSRANSAGSVGRASRRLPDPAPRVLAASAHSEGVSEPAAERPLDLAALAQRAQKAVDGRLESGLRVRLKGEGDPVLHPLPTAKRAD